MGIHNVSRNIGPTSVTAFEHDSKNWNTELIAISQQLVNNSSESGFLLEPVDELDFKYLGEEGLHNIVVLRNGKPVGLLLFVEIGDRDDADSKEVNQLLYGIRPDLNSKKGVFLEKLLVDPDFSRQGIASSMIDQLLRSNPNLDYILSSVVVEPQCNHASLALHHKLGFRDLELIGADTEWLHKPDYVVPEIEPESEDSVFIDVSFGDEHSDVKSLLLLREIDY